MGRTFEQHRPLMAGLRIRGETKEGTLTGAATRHAGRETVLVTALHVAVDDFFDPTPNVAMLQPPPYRLGETENPVGRMVYWGPLTRDYENTIDAAVFEPDSGIAISYGIHSPYHDFGIVIPGAKEPEEGMELTVVGSVSGIVQGRVRGTDRATRALIDEHPVTNRAFFYGWHNVIALDLPVGSLSEGDSGGPILFEEAPGLFRMVGTVLQAVNGSQRQTLYAVKTSLMETEMGITFGAQPEITTRSRENMGIAILTSEGFAGQRWIIDDYFKAGETLHAGDVVGIKEQAASPNLPRVFKIDVGVDVPRVIGVVHTPADKDVGDQVTTPDNLVSVVVQGVAKVLSSRAISVGDPVTPSGNSGFAPGKINRVARAGIATTENDAFIGRCVKGTSGANEVAEILVDISGGHDSTVVAEPQRSAFDAPTGLRAEATVRGGQLKVAWTDPTSFDRTRDYYQYQYRVAGVGASWVPEAPLQTSLFKATIAGLPAIAHQVRVQAVYHDPEGFDEGESLWEEADGTPANNLPVANAGLDRTVDTGVTVTLQGSGTDLDGDTLTYLWEQLNTGAPTVTLSNNAVARPTFSAPTMPTILKFQLTVSDIHQGIGTNVVTVTVEQLSPLSNDATLSTLGLTPSTLSLVPAFDSATISYAVSADNAVSSIRVTPTLNQANAMVTVNGAAVTSGQESQQITLSVGETTITVVVTAQDGTTTKTYTVAVTRAALVNQAPTADAGAPQTVNRGETVTLDASGSSDPENETLTYSWTKRAGPSVTLSNATSASATFTAPSTPTSLTFRVTVTDSQGNEDTDDVVITVQNRAPTADAGYPQTVNRGESVTLDASGSSDPDGDSLTYSWTKTAGPSLSLTNASSATPSFTTPSTPTSLTFQVAVSDGWGGTDTDEVVITVQNRAPTADAGARQTVSTGDTVTLDGSGSSDPDGDSLTYSWTKTTGPSLSLTNASSATPSFTTPSTPTSLTFQVTVSDGWGGTDTDEVVITVQNRAPTADAGVAQTVNFGTVVTLDASGSSDPDGDGLNYGWYQLSGTTVSIIDSASARPSFAAPSSAATLTFRLTVSDGYGGNDTDDVTVTVEAPAATPYLSSIVCEGKGLTFNSLESTVGIFLNLAVDFNLDDGAGNITTETLTSFATSDSTIPERSTRSWSRSGTIPGSPFGCGCPSRPAWHPTFLRVTSLMSTQSRSLAVRRLGAQVWRHWPHLRGRTSANGTTPFPASQGTWRLR